MLTGTQRKRLEQLTRQAATFQPMNMYECIELHQLKQAEREHNTLVHNTQAALHRLSNGVPYCKPSRLNLAYIRFVKEYNQAKA